ncbi:hypothetical protein K6119_05025 [Paracrocinitomix mangrovi]|uniref:hypothetical protein n=1 Tax=Paracrocinitomix mangrovi TaxID=2862509 RepID=UPI001C8D1447|nr:hypothetical protein [Paracrocinitomix mangrovi]UKN02875.1 hypothetical protein K6119_05025 [Paracrocinitomix mangrovi]
MSEVENLADSVAPVEGKNSPKGIKSITVFSYLGKVLLIILSIGFMLMLYYMNDMFVDDAQDAEMSTSEWLMWSYITCSLYIITAVVGWIGIRKMVKGKRKGFYMHTLANLTMVGYLLFRGNLLDYFIAAGLALFIFLYLPFLGKLKN